MRQAYPLVYTSHEVDPTVSPLYHRQGHGSSEKLSTESTITQLVSKQKNQE